MPEQKAPKWQLLARRRCLCGWSGPSACGSIPDEISLKADIEVFVTDLAQQADVVTDVP